MKRLPVAEFRRLGYLAELNRQFLHPLGLALEVVEEGGTERFGGVWDYRDNPEGMAFDAFTDEERANAARIENERLSKRVAREAIGIWPVQPLIP